MGFKASFLAGFAAGYVAGSAAGRERYEQIKSIGAKAAENPTVRQATGAVGTKAAELSKTAADKASDKLPKFASNALNKVSSRNSTDTATTSRVNGSVDYPADGT